MHFFIFQVRSYIRAQGFQEHFGQTVRYQQRFYRVVLYKGKAPSKSTIALPKTTGGAGSLAGAIESQSNEENEIPKRVPQSKALRWVVASVLASIQALVREPLEGPDRDMQWHLLRKSDRK